MLKDDKKFWMALIWIAYFAFLELTSLGRTSEAFPCILVSNEAQTKNESGYQTCAAMHEAVFRFVRFVWDNTTHDNIIAFGTIAIAAFTYTLFRATTKLWSANAQHSERELRAYVSIEPKIVYNFGAINPVVIGADAKNHGRTPATEIAYDFSMGPLPNPLPVGFIFPAPSRQLNVNNSLFPDASVPTRFQNNNLLTAPEITAIETDVQRFHIWGVAHYRDAFGDRRTTRISASFGGFDFTQTLANAAAGIFGQNGTPTPGWFWAWGSITTMQLRRKVALLCRSQFDFLTGNLSRH
jgi:hypothetical protein